MVSFTTRPYFNMAANSDATDVPMAVFSHAQRGLSELTPVMVSANFCL
jgi:hypothetical protein